RISLRRTTAAVPRLLARRGCARARRSPQLHRRGADAGASRANGSRDGHRMSAPTLSLPVIIPAAGLGARFLPLSRVVPKELLPLGNRPLIHHAVLEAERAGLGPVTIVTSPSKRAIRSYFEDDTLPVSGSAAAVAAAREPSRLAQ